MNAAKKRLDRNDWTEAALDAMGEQGTAGINVEELARTLGTTKGSFYHHFENREALLLAALARWEELIDEDIAAAQDISDPRERLIELALTGASTNLSGFVDLALGASMSDPVVAATLKRANESRLRAIEAIFRELGTTVDTARQRAILALGSYLGLYQVQRVVDQRLSESELRVLVVRAIESTLD